MSGQEPRRGWLEVRWRQFRRAPTPIVRAVVANTAVAAALGVPLLVYDAAVEAGIALPGGDLRVLAVSIFVATVAIMGALLTYLTVPLPGRPGRRSAWSGALGFFAALPIAYLTLVVLFQIIEPLVVGAG
jgi:hypothetical protein